MAHKRPALGCLEMRNYYYPYCGYMGRSFCGTIAPVVIWVPNPELFEGGALKLMVVLIDQRSYHTRGPC